VVGYSEGNPAAVSMPGASCFPATDPGVPAGATDVPQTKKPEPLVTKSNSNSAAFGIEKEHHLKSARFYPLRRLR
jgi:hypothetical protein